MIKSLLSFEKLKRGKDVTIFALGVRLRIRAEGRHSLSYRKRALAALFHFCF